MIPTSTGALVREDGHADAGRVNVNSDERRSVGNPIDGIRRRSTILQQFLEASAVIFAAEIRIGFILAVAKSVHIKIRTVLADNCGGASEAYSVAVVVVACAQTRSVRLDIIPEALGLRGMESDCRKKRRDQYEEECR